MRTAALAVLAGTLASASSEADPAPVDRVIRVTAKKFEFTPSTINLEVGVPVIIEIVSLDRKHGFNVPELNVRADVPPGGTVRVRIVPDKEGTFEFRCDVFCGEGHEDMAGQIVVHPARGPTSKAANP